MPIPSGMAVGAQNDLGGQQTFARNMTWCIAFLCQNWDGFYSQMEVFSTEIWTVFLSKLGCSPKKKKKMSSLKLKRFFVYGVPK